VRRRRFDHLWAELSVELGRLVPRYPLWLALHEFGLDPERLAVQDLLRFWDGPLPAFLRAHGLFLPPRRARSLRRRVARFDPSLPTPYERFAALTR
jgi:hypothetical protein